MADDPRQEVLAKRLAADENDDAHWTGYLREAGLHIAALNAVDPSRALLADEDRAVEVIREAIAKSDGGTLSSRYLKETSVAVLAALREVAGNG